MSGHSNSEAKSRPIAEALQATVPGLRVEWTAESREAHSRDHTEDLQFLPDVVVFPTSTEEVSAVMRWAHAKRVPVTPSGAWTGLSGGALPVRGGIGLSTKRLNQIVRIDELNHQLVVQPGAIVQEMQEAVQAKACSTPSIRPAVAPAPSGQPRREQRGPGPSNTASPKTGPQPRGRARRRHRHPDRSRHPQEQHRIQPDPAHGRVGGHPWFHH